MTEFQNIIDDFVRCTREMKGSLSALSEESFLEAPYPGKWSAGEILEHLYISDRSALYAMTKNAMPADRDPLEKAADFEVRRKTPDQTYEAPDAARPKGAFTSKEEALRLWTENREKMIRLAETEDLSMLAGGFTHPKLGMMSRAEWLLFVTWHTDHHLRQVLAFG